jgi:hypothetical protein
MKMAYLLSEALEQDYYIAKTTDSEVKELLLRGHYLGHWPFAGSQYKDYIYGIYLKKQSKQLPLVPLVKDEQPINDDTLIGCIVYGFPEFHASSYVSKWIRGLLNPDESIEDIYTNIKGVIEKDKTEEEKAKARGYPYQPKARTIIRNILNATNVQDSQILELKRLYILPKFDLKNIESFAIGRGNKAIFDNNPNIQAIVSFSDSKVGHYGGVYQATNALYAGINKPGLHRYIYPRDTLASTVKRYQKEYEQLVFQYPKKPEPKAEPESDINDYGLDLSKRERIASRYLKNRLPQIQDATLKAAVIRVLDMIEKSPQQTFQFKEVKTMILKEMITESILQSLNENDPIYDEKMGRKWGVKDKITGEKRDISKFSLEWQKGYKQVQREQWWSKLNSKLTDYMGRLGSSYGKRF